MIYLNLSSLDMVLRPGRSDLPTFFCKNLLGRKTKPNSYETEVAGVLETYLQQEAKSSAEMTHPKFHETSIDFRVSWHPTRSQTQASPIPCSVACDLSNQFSTTLEIGLRMCWVRHFCSRNVAGGWVSMGVVGRYYSSSICLNIFYFPIFEYIVVFKSFEWFFCLAKSSLPPWCPPYPLQCDQRSPPEKSSTAEETLGLQKIRKICFMGRFGANKLENLKISRHRPPIIRDSVKPPDQAFSSYDATVRPVRASFPGWRFRSVPPAPPGPKTETKMPWTWLFGRTTSIGFGMVQSVWCSLVRLVRLVQVIWPIIFRIFSLASETNVREFHTRTRQMLRGVAIELGSDYHVQKNIKISPQFRFRLMCSFANGGFWGTGCTTLSCTQSAHSSVDITLVRCIARLKAQTNKKAVANGQNLDPPGFFEEKETKNKPTQRGRNMETPTKTWLCWAKQHHKISNQTKPCYHPPLSLTKNNSYTLIPSSHLPTAGDIRVSRTLSEWSQRSPWPVHVICSSVLGYLITPCWALKWSYSKGLDLCSEVICVWEVTALLGLSWTLPPASRKLCKTSDPFFFVSLACNFWDTQRKCSAFGMPKLEMLGRMVKIFKWNPRTQPKSPPLHVGSCLF